ncbi:hypothetical protein [Actinocatenispora comari]|uniref:hypothetical protein n=1 Tax=Actinocatenispora comari TaxID=2807577 RepID=UPI001A92F3D6|nr:hypothetical protein [Actinocatenispora comari]
MSWWEPPDEDSIRAKVVVALGSLAMGVGGGIYTCLHVSLLLGLTLLIAGCLIGIVGVASLIRRVALGDALARRKSSGADEE